MIPMLFLISIVLFGLVNLAPGGPMAGAGLSRRTPPEKAAELRRQFGLDQPLPVQYLIWLVGNDWMRVDLDGDGASDRYGTRKGCCAATSASCTRVAAQLWMRSPSGCRIRST